MEKETQIRLEAYGGQKIKALGTITLKSKIKNKAEYIEFVIVNTTSKPLLGLESCKKLNLVKKVDIVQLNETKKKATFIKKNKEIFEGLGECPHMVNIKVKEGAIPVINPPRRVPLMLKNDLKINLRN